MGRPRQGEPGGYPGQADTHELECTFWKTDGRGIGIVPNPDSLANSATCFFA